MSSAPADTSSSMREIARAMARTSPARTRSESGVPAPGGVDRLAGKELAGDDKSLDFAGALADRRELHVPEEFLGGIVLHEPVPAVNLNAVLRGAYGNFACVQFGHRGLERH